MRPAVHAALVAVALGLTSLPARAQPRAGQAGDVTEDDRAVARRHFLRGKELHAAGNYREAATAYLEAYERFPAPAFLYNVAQVYRLAGDREAALVHYRRYLELEPEGEGSADAREFIATLEAAIGSEAGRGASDGAAQPEEPADTRRADPIDPIERSHSPVDRRLGGSPGRGKKIAGASIGAVGAVGLGVAVAFGLKARSAADELDAYEGPWGETQDQTYQDGETAERTMLLSAAVGGAALATGAILYVLGSRESRRADRARRDRDAGIARGPEPGFQLGATATEDSAFVLLRGAF